MVNGGKARRKEWQKRPLCLKYKCRREWKPEWYANDCPEKKENTEGKTVRRNETRKNFIRTEQKAKERKENRTERNTDELVYVGTKDEKNIGIKKWRETRDKRILNVSKHETTRHGRERKYSRRKRRTTKGCRNARPEKKILKVRQNTTGKRKFLKYRSEDRGKEKKTKKARN